MVVSYVLETTGAWLEASMPLILEAAAAQYIIVSIWYLPNGDSGSDIEAEAGPAMQEMAYYVQLCNYASNKKKQMWVSEYLKLFRISSNYCQYSQYSRPAGMFI